MKLLLDTHAILWWLDGDRRFGPTAKSLVLDGANQRLVSVVSFWEIVIKTKSGKLQVSLDDVSSAIGSYGFSLLGIEREHLRTLSTLHTFHRDPFDHLLIAQAAAEGAALMSDDAKFRDYDVAVIRCSA